MKNINSYLKNNLIRLQKTDPKLTFQLRSFDPSDLQYCQTEQGELNLKRLYQGATYYYHSPFSAQKEADDWFNHLNLHQTQVLYIYGIGLGYYYLAALSWLKGNKERKLVFLEEDKGVLYRLFETSIGSTLLKDSQVQIVYFEDLLEDKALFNELSWAYLDCSFEVSCLKLYQEVNLNGFLQLHHHLSYSLVEKKAFVEEYLQYGIAFFRNFYPNLLDLPKAYWGNGLFGQFKQIPAIICGAGPSLNKNIHLLDGLKEKALLFAGSSALNALIPKGILPHFGVAIDPNQAQLPRVAIAQPHQVPFFYRNRLFHRALQAISGPRLYLTGTGGYNLSEWFEKELEIEGENLDEGHNVVNFCIEIAQALGCNPIILVGVDLAFTNQQPYADGVAANLNLTEKDFKTNEDFESQPLLKEDIDGQPVYTLWKWITEAEWIADFAKNHSETTVINATEGGIGFKDIPNQSLDKALHSYSALKENLQEKVEQAIAQQSLSFISSSHLIELVKVFQSSLDNCIELLTRLINSSHELLVQIQNGEAYPSSLQTPAISLLESDIEEEVAYQYLLDTFNQVYIRVHHRAIQSAQQPQRGWTTKRRNVKKMTLQLQRLTFLKEVAHVNRELIQMALQG